MTPTQTKLLNKLDGNCHKWQARDVEMDPWRAARACDRALYRELPKPWATKPSAKPSHTDLRRGERLAPLALDNKLAKHLNRPSAPSTSMNPRMKALLAAQASNGLVDPTGVRRRLSFDAASTAACAA